MKSTPIYIKSLKLDDIRTFGKDVTLDLEKQDHTIPQWTLILGDNSIGKSTLLQCIAWMKPYLPYKLDETDDFIPAPIITDEENETLERLVRRDKQSGKLKAVFVSKKEINQKISIKNEITLETNLTILLDNKRKLKDAPYDVDYNKKNEKHFTEEILIFAYSASRQLGKLNLNDPKLLETIPSFTKEKTELYDADEILHALNYASRASKTIKEKKKYGRILDEIKEMLVKILPDFQIIKDIEIMPPITGGGVLINTRHGKKIPFADFSLGYKTVTSWTIDLAWRLFNKYKDISSNPLKESAIVLIDEVDLHLHPVWQREIMNNLSLHFPNIQFIATAHSPLMVQAAIDANYAVLKFDRGSVKIENNPKGIDGWRVDQILTSEFFDVKSSRGAAYESLLAEREYLTNKRKLTLQQKRRLSVVNNRMSLLPTGENPEEIENRKIISELVSKIKKNNIKIEL